MYSQRILSLNPGSRQIGYAYFEGRNLIDWGIKSNTGGKIRDRILKRGLDLVVQLFQEFDPEIVILPANRNTSRRTNKERFAKAIKAILGDSSTRAVSFSTRQTSGFFEQLTAPERPTKQRIMAVLIDRFPELGHLVPRPRRPWDPQDYWTPMFDAVARAVAWFHSHHES